MKSNHEYSIMNFHHLTKGMGIGVLFILQKMEEGTFLSKKREVAKIVEK